MTPKRTLLESLGLHRPELRAWAMYDWATSAMQAVVMTAIFPIFFAAVARAAGREGVAATKAWADLNTWTLVGIALLSPLLGAIADRAPVKKRGLAAFMLIGVGGTAGMFFIHEGQLARAGQPVRVVELGEHDGVDPLGVGGALDHPGQLGADVRQQLVPHAPELAQVPVVGERHPGVRTPRTPGG